MKIRIIKAAICIIALIVLFVVVCNHEPVEAKKAYRFDVVHREFHGGSTYEILYDIQTGRKYLLVDTNGAGTGICELRGGK